MMTPDPCTVDTISISLRKKLGLRVVRTADFPARVRQIRVRDLGGSGIERGYACVRPHPGERRQVGVRLPTGRTPVESRRRTAAAVRSLRLRCSNSTGQNQQVEYLIKRYALEAGALEIQYIEEYFGEFPRKKTAAEITARLRDRDSLILMAEAA